MDGIGGVGKTTLVLEAAYRCLRASQKSSAQIDQGIPTFEAIVFTSAKRQFLAPFGLVERVGRSQRTLQAEWQNIQPVIEWCMNQGRYEDLLTLWKCVDIHIHLQGDRPHCRRWWGVHLDWLNWLIQIARQRDADVAVELIASRGWLLTAMGGPEQLREAEQFYIEAWQARQQYPLRLQLNLVINLAALQVRRGNADQAQSWLDQAVRLAESDSLDPKERLTQQSRIDYYQGVVAFHKAAYQTAKRHFERAVAQAQQIDWQRVVQRSQNWLAEIALRQRDLPTAKDME